MNRIIIVYSDNTDFQLKLDILTDKDDNICTALEPYDAKNDSNSSRKSSKESLPYRYIEESNSNTSDTASSVVSYPSLPSRAPSEISIESNNTENRALSSHSIGDNISAVSSVPSRGTSSYGRARLRRGQPRNTRGGGIQRPIDRPMVLQDDFTVAVHTGQAGPKAEELMKVGEYIEKFQLHANYPFKRLEKKPEELFRVGSKILCCSYLIFPGIKIRTISSLLRLHMKGKQLENPVTESDSCWDAPGPFRSIHANEIKRKGGMGVDLGDINIPIDAILQTCKEGIGHSYLVLERGNCRVQAFDGSREPVGTQYENRDLLQHQYIERYIKLN